MNPEVWPPLVDEDAFDAPAAGSPTQETVTSMDSSDASELTPDDLD